MSHVIEFCSTGISSESAPENPFNPIKGHALGMWLSERLADQGLVVAAVEPEDWGWYSELTHLGRNYLLGYIEYEEENSFAVQVEKQRSFLEKLSRKEKMNPEDEVSRLIIANLEASGICTDVQVQY